MARCSHNSPTFEEEIWKRLSAQTTKMQNTCGPNSTGRLKKRNVLQWWSQLDLITRIFQNLEFDRFSRYCLTNLLKSRDYD